MVSKFQRKTSNVKPKKRQYLGRKRFMVTEAQVRGWFKDRKNYFQLKDLLDVIKDPKHVFNFDETNVTFYSSIPFVLTVQGFKSTKHVFLHTNDMTEKGSVRGLILVSASGEFPSSMMIIKGTRPDPLKFPVFDDENQ